MDAEEYQKYLRLYTELRLLESELMEMYERLKQVNILMRETILRKN